MVVAGDLISTGKLIVLQETLLGTGYSEMASSVTFGSRPEHTVQILSGLTTLVRLNATGDTVLGGEDR